MTDLKGQQSKLSKMLGSGWEVCGFQQEFSGEFNVEQGDIGSDSLVILLRKEHQLAFARHGIKPPPKGRFLSITFLTGEEE